MGQLVRNMLQNLDWYSTLFPRIPVPVQKQINAVIANKCVHFYYTETTKREVILPLPTWVILYSPYSIFSSGFYSLNKYADKNVWI